jgi:hypothetical protein
MSLEIARPQGLVDPMLGTVAEKIDIDEAPPIIEADLSFEISSTRGAKLVNCCSS